MAATAAAAAAAAPPAAAAARKMTEQSLAEYRDALLEKSGKEGGAELPTMNEADLDRAAILFRDFDTNADGVLDFAEFSAVQLVGTGLRPV